MKILISAEAQGFGLSSIAVSLSSLFTGHKLTYIGKGLAYEYFKKEGCEVCELKDFKDLGNIISMLKSYELLVSINESRLAIIAKKIGLKVIYLDLLYWLWPLELNKDIKEYAKRIKIMPIEKLAAELDDDAGKVYDKAFIKRRGFLSIIAGLISDSALIQDFPLLSKEKKELFRGEKTFFVHPFIRKYDFKNDFKREGRKSLFVSLGGIPSQNNYAAVFSIVLKNLKKSKTFNVGSSLLQVEHKTYRHRDLMEEIVNSDVILTPPGSITILEIFSLNKPVFYLPPKNAGQYVIFKMFQDLGLTDFIVDWKDIYPEVNKTDCLWDTMKLVERNMTFDKKLPVNLAKRINNGINKIIDSPRARSRLIRKQSRFLKSISSSNLSIEDCFREILRGLH